MDLKTQLNGLNRYLSLVYGVPISLSMLLAKMGFTEDQLRLLHRDHVDEITNSFIGLLRGQTVRGRLDDRDYTIVCRRFGLDGRPPETLQVIGDRLGITRERVRQLEKKLITRQRHTVRRRALEQGLYDLANGLSGIAQPHEPALPLSVVSEDIPTISARLKITAVQEAAHENVETWHEYIEAILRILAVVPDGLRPSMITHILYGSEGPKVNALVSAYKLTEYGIFRSHGYKNVRRMVLSIWTTDV